MKDKADFQDHIIYIGKQRLLCSNIIIDNLPTFRPNVLVILRAVYSEVRSHNDGNIIFMAVIPGDEYAHGQRLECAVHQLCPQFLHGSNPAAR